MAHRTQFRCRNPRHLQARLANCYGKATGQIARLALLLEYLWWASGDDFDDSDPPENVGVKAVRAAIRLREEYVKVMQRRVYDQMIETQEVTNARLIAQWIIAEKVDRLNASHVRREAGLRGLNANTPADVVDAAMAVLVSMRWIMPEEIDEGQRKRGRPAKNFTVNNRVWDLLDKDD